MANGTAPTTSAGKVPEILTVVLADTYGTEIAVIHENSYRPYQRRTVQIRLTEEQRAALAPRYVGMRGPDPVHEEILECWLEPVEPIEEAAHV